MDIKQELKLIASEIGAIEARTNGWSIGTSLQEYLERVVNKILPPYLGYEFFFNFSGHIRHVFYEKGNPRNFVEY